MRKKPIIFNILSFFFLMIAVSMPIQIYFLFDHQGIFWNEIISVFHKLTTLNIAIMVLAFVNSLLIYQVNPLVKWLIPLSVVAVGVNNFIVGSWGIHYDFLTTWMATILYMIFSYAYSFGPSLQAIQDPRCQWWKIPKRLRKSYPVWIEFENGKKILAKTFDISASGTFISSMGKTPQMLNQQQGKRVTLHIGTAEGDVMLKAEIVREAINPQGAYPMGLGLRFHKFSLKAMWQIKKLLTNKEMMASGV